MNEGPVSLGVAFRHDLLRVSLVSRLLYCLSKKKRINQFILIYFYNAEVSLLRYFDQ